MVETEFHIDEDLAPYVNCIMSGKNSSVDSHTNIPLYADGYPGIMFQESERGFYILPKKKKLSEREAVYRKEEIKETKVRISFK